MARFWLMTLMTLMALIGWASPAAAAAPSCADQQAEGASFTVCDFDVRAADIRLFLRDEKGALYGGFSALADAVSAKGETLLFAMNAPPDETPVGLYVEAGKTLHQANTMAGAGNFHLKPNGVFWIDGARAGVTETGRFLKSRAHPAYATQSGPMLVINGRIHPRIHESGTSEKYRNGVCVQGGHVARFAISNQPVTFHQFAALFKDHLHCADALFLDGGTASAIYAPSISRHDRFHPMAPMIGVVGRKGLGLAPHPDPLPARGERGSGSRTAARMKATICPLSPLAGRGLG